MSDEIPSIEERLESLEPEASHAPVKPAGRSWLPATIVGAVVLILAVSGTVVWLALNKQAAKPLTRHDMVTTAISGIEAVISGDGDTLFSLSSDRVKSQLTSDVLSKMDMSGIAVDFSEPQWNGDNFVITVTTTEGQGVLLGGPVPDGKNVVLFRTMGMILATTGGVSFQEAPSGWLISEFAIGRSAPTSSSVSPTGTPSATSTP